MTKQRNCHYCGAPLPEIRLGVRLTPVKARIFDIIQRSGEDGIFSEDLFNIVFSDSDPQPLKANMFTHICGINDLIEDTEYRIRSHNRGKHTAGFYRLEKRNDRKYPRDGRIRKKHAGKANNGGDGQARSPKA